MRTPIGVAFPSMSQETPGTGGAREQAQASLEASQEAQAPAEAQAEADWFKEQGEPLPVEPEQTRKSPELEDEIDDDPFRGEEEEDEEQPLEDSQEDLEDDDDDERSDEEERKPQRKRLSRRQRRELKTAIEALRLDGTPSSVLDSTSPEELIEWGLEAKERQKTRSRRLDFAAELAADGQPTEEARQSKGADERTSELDESVYQAVADQMALSVDEVKKAWGPLTQDLLKKARAEAAKEIAPIRESAQATSRNEAERQVQSNISRLAEIHPELSKDTGLQEDLIERAAAYWSAKTHDGVRLHGELSGAFDDAFRSLVGPIRSPEEVRQSRVRQRRRNGVATIPSRDVSAKKRGKTVDDYESEILDRIEAGASFEELSSVKKPSRAAMKKSRKRRALY